MAQTRTAKGTANSKTLGTVLQISGVTIDAGATLVVGIAWENDNAGEKPTIKIGNRDLKYVAGSESQRGDTIVRQYKTRVKVSKAKDIVATWTTALTARAMFATQITEASAPDKVSVNDQGTAAGLTKNTGTAIDTSVANTIHIAAFACIGDVVADGDPTAVGAGHTLGQGTGTTGGASGTNLHLHETYEILTAIGGARATLTQNTNRGSAACVVAYKSRQTFTIKAVEQRQWTQNHKPNYVWTKIEDEGGRGFWEPLDPNVFDDMTDAEYKDWVKGICDIWTANILDSEYVPEENSTRDTRMSGFVNDKINL